ncbi:MAG: hypothetical protein GYB64_01500 [Chloroflexi bacterium]|nr:hypothetical protein [Chloroflexota bacterium]
MQRVLVVDKNKNPLMPTSPARARQLLSKGKAAVMNTITPHNQILWFQSREEVDAYLEESISEAG